MHEDEFEPELGKIGSRRAPRERSYLQRVLHSTTQVGGSEGRGKQF
jgi:hypothetical protein